jgi:hypothetical protein
MFEVLKKILKKEDVFVCIRELFDGNVCALMANDKRRQKIMKYYRKTIVAICIFAALLAISARSYAVDKIVHVDNFVDLYNAIESAIPDAMTVIHLDADIDAVTSATLGLRTHAPEPEINQPWLGWVTIEGNGHVIDGGDRKNSALRFHNRLDSAPRTSKIILRNLTMKNLNSSIGYGGGAIGVRGGEHEIENCAFIDNSWTPADPKFTQRGGGAVYAEQPGGFLKITNSTFFGNKAAANKEIALSEKGDGGIGGGAIYAAGEASVTNCTIVNNRVTNETASPISVYGGGIFRRANAADSFTLSNSIVADNFIKNGASAEVNDDVYDAKPAAAATLTDGDYNLIKTAVGTGGAAFTAASHSAPNAAISDWAFLDSKPQNNGGSTLTIALLTETNPAVNQIPAGAPDNDQRGFKRVGPADIGAYEYGAAEPTN